ncbi:NAD(P)-binding protein [Hygrophoropsis aurantiaca]|uniref:NAD(P)-binding protein n=1 Tax=Hygrophoropsis aurantiaca TaxID=72124 RepID=A0ACB8ATD2_9AGAM|nr:NAD(P)-binding protein [Hygrophoropsis aurantiaca]
MGFFNSGFNPVSDLSDLSGKVILVTGGSAGIGYSTVKHLARHGAKVYMAARSETRAKEAIEKLVAEGLGPGNGKVIFLQLDLADPRNAKKAAEELMCKENRLDVLIHNAGMLIEKYSKSVDGIQDVMMVNVVSPFALTQSLLPLLKQSAVGPNADVRIVIVSSDGHNTVRGDPRFRNTEDLNEECKDAYIPGFARYCRSKLANVLYARELQRRLLSEGTNITVLAVHPGTVKSAFTERPPYVRYKRILDILVYPIFFSSTDVGAHSSTFAAASERVRKERERYQGAYLSATCNIQKLSKVPMDDALAKELYETVESVLTEKGVI